MADVPYCAAVGFLVYLNVWYRPDISKATQELSQFSHNPGRRHWGAVKRAYCYLDGTADHGLTFTSSGTGRLKLVAWIDADWASDLDNRKSVAAFVLTLNGTIVSWSSKQLTTICLSTAESEYGALSGTGREVLAARATLHDLKQIQDAPTLINCDSQAAIALASNARFHARTRHIEVAPHFIRELIESKRVQVQYISSESNISDLLTKGLSKDRNVSLCLQLGLNTTNSNETRVSGSKSIA